MALRREILSPTNCEKNCDGSWSQSANVFCSDVAGTFSEFATWQNSGKGIINCCILLYCFALQGSALCGVRFKTGKAAALPVAKQYRLQSKDLYLLGGHRYWCSETSGRSRKYGHKKCPESLLGRLSPPLELCSSVSFRRGKGTKKNGTNKQISKNFT